MTRPIYTRSGSPKRWLPTAAAAVVIALGLAACGGSDAPTTAEPATATEPEVVATEAPAPTLPPATDAPADTAAADAPSTTEAIVAAERGELITLARNAAPATLDPSQANVDPNHTTHLQLTYASLFYMNPDRSFSGDLAEEWGYTDDKNQVFEIRLREGLVFADGTPLSANEVAASLNHYIETGRNTKAWLSGVTSITATDDLTVVVEASKPTPDLQRILSSDKLAGAIISPAGLANLEGMATASFGAGAYVMDPSSVPGDTYVYVPNETYWNKAVQRWEKVVVKVVPDNNAVVQAMQVGQIDFTTQLTGAQFQQAKDAGLGLDTGAGALLGVMLADRNGELNPAIGDQKVRQAMALAIDRDAICGAVFGGAQISTAQMPAPGWGGFDAALNDKYAFNVEAAKALMAESGFAGGFELELEATAPLFPNLAQGVADAWKQLGITTTITTSPDIPTGQAAQIDKKFASYMFGNGLNSAPLLVGLHLTTANAFNPWDTHDSEIDALATEGASLSDDEAAAVYAKMFDRVADLAWNVPLCYTPTIVASVGRLGGWEIPENGVVPSPLELFES